MNSKRLDSKGLRLGIMLMGEKLFIICSILLTIIFFVTPIQASAASAFGIVRVAPPLSICMQGETHYLEDPCDGSLVTRLLSDTIDLNWYLDQYVEVEGTEIGVECSIINVQNIVILPEPICPTNSCITNSDCGTENWFWFYCAKPSGDCVGEGVCTLVPECSTCPYYFWPVCGCDGITYAGDCWAACIGRVSVAYPGPCISELECSIWADVILTYQVYVSGQAMWADVIDCYNQYASP